MSKTTLSLLQYLRITAAALHKDTRTDSELLSNYAKGRDESAFAVLVIRHGALVWSVCRQILGNTHDVEDAFQGTFLALSRKANQVRSSTLAGWLHQVARQAALDVRKATGSRQRLQEHLQTMIQQEVPQQTERTETYEVLHDELACLSEKLRGVLVLHYLEGKTKIEVARILGVSESAVRKRLTRGESVLRERLSQRGIYAGVATLVTLLHEASSRAAVPTSLVRRTVVAAVAFRNGTLSGGTAELARHLLQSLSFGTGSLLKGWLVALVCVGGLGTGAVVWRAAFLSRLDTDGRGGISAQESPSQRIKKESGRPRLDPNGDTLLDTRNYGRSNMTKPASWLGVGLCGGMLLLARTPVARANEIPAEYKACIHKGLEWLAKQQFPDGHWEASGSQYPEAMTALSGMSFLMEGSTLREGKYADRIRKAVEWLVGRNMRNGMIGNPHQGGHYMYGHGYALIFLSCIYGEEGDTELRRKLQDILTRAVQFTGKAQSQEGGWHYVAASEISPGGDSSSSVTQMQALRAARNAGIVVPKEIVNKGVDYLRKTTNGEGGVRYGSNAGPDSRPALTAAALASAFGAGQYESDLVKKWLKFCQRHIPLETSARIGHDEYTNYYLAQVAYVLGEDRYAKLFPDARPEDHLTWTKYRKSVCDRLLRIQSADGSWDGATGIGASGIGPVYVTALHLAIMQLDNGTLPLYQR